MAKGGGGDLPLHGEMPSARRWETAMGCGGERRRRGASSVLRDDMPQRSASGLEVWDGVHGRGAVVRWCGGAGGHKHISANLVQIGAWPALPPLLAGEGPRGEGVTCIPDPRQRLCFCASAPTTANFQAHGRDRRKRQQARPTPPRVDCACSLPGLNPPDSRAASFPPPASPARPRRWRASCRAPWRLRPRCRAGSPPGVRRS